MMSLLKLESMRTYLWIVLVCILSSASCRDETEPSTFEQDTEQLETMLEQIRAFAQSKSCEDSDDWAFAPYGAKPCGGPWGYLAYATDIDTSELFAMIEAYDKANRDYNEKWELGSDCSLEPIPTGVVCEGGRPVLIF